MKRCNYCGAPLDDDSQFCTNCGKKVEPQENTCPQCETVIEDDAAFCSKCGMRLDTQTEPPVATPQVVIPETSSQEEEIVYEWEEEKERKWWYIIGGIIIVALLAIGGYFILKQNSNSDSSPNVEREPIVLKGSIDESIGFSMKLRFKGNEIVGSEHYDKQKSKDTLLVKGSIDEKGYLVLHEYNNLVECGSYEGILTDDSYSGTFTNSRGKSMQFSGQGLSESDLAKEEDAIQMISKKGTIIANVEWKIYYLGRWRILYRTI